MKIKANFFLIILLSAGLMLINSGCNIFVSFISDLQRKTDYITISPGNNTLMTGERIQFNANYYDYENNINMDITREAEWDSSNEGVAMVSSGYVITYSAGMTEISVAYNDIKTKVSIDVITPIETEIFFEKKDYADSTLPENQDWVTETVRITRGDNHAGLYNAYSESEYIPNFSPADTEWSLGPTDSYTVGEYRNWERAIGNALSHLNETISMHIISEDLWYNIVFISWTESGMGGGFAYYRDQADPPSGYPPPGVFFKKYDNTDPFAEINQDRISPSVWITRGENAGGIFNACNETGYISNSSPSGTEWALGHTSENSLIDYSNWENTISYCPGCYLYETISLHIIPEDLWFDVIFTSWTETDGGGFSYYREEADLPPTGGGIVSFQKFDGTNPLLEENQDRITPHVWITRGPNSGGIYNIYNESAYTPYSSPIDTQWAIGETSNQPAGNYRDWENTILSCPGCYLNSTISLHIIPEDIYFDVIFSSWSSTSDGFAYTRTEVPPPMPF